MEAVIIVDVLRRAGADVLVASVERELEVEASSGTRLVADASIADCADEIFDLVALPVRFETPIQALCRSSWYQMHMKLILSRRNYDVFCLLYSKLELL